MGRRPLPPHLKVIRGNPGRRPVKPTVKVPAGLPSPPDVLGADALAEWHRIAPLLYARGVLTELDRAALAAYAQAYGTWVAASRDLAAAGELMVATRTGYRTPHPLLSICARARADAMKIGAEFGLTPTSRGRVNATPPEDDDDPASRYFD